jgi:protein TonB
VGDTYTYGKPHHGRAWIATHGATLATVVALHVLAVWLLLQVDALRNALAQAAPIMVSLITPQPKPEVKPETLPKPLPVRKRVERPKPVAPPPVITAPREAEAPYVAPVPPPAPLPPVEAPVALAAAPEPIAAPPAPPPPAAPAPVTPPIFHADYLNNPPPVYPPLSRRMGEEGRVVLRVYVSEQGLPRDIQVRTSSGYSRLDEAASSTVRQWRFVPARRGDVAVGAWVLVPISFSLRS